MPKQLTRMITKYQSSISIILLICFFFLLFLFPFSRGEAQTSEWIPAWVDFGDSGLIHIVGLDADTIPKVEAPISAETHQREKPISNGLLATITQIFSSFAQNTPSRETAGWETIFSDDLESTFPGEWNVFDNDGATNGEYFWAQKDCRPYAGSYSAWVVGGGTDGSILPCGSDYPNDAKSWMIYGPFSLADATDAEFRFMYRLNSELSFDLLFAGASIDGTQFYGASTSGTNDWTERIFDLTTVDTLGDLTGEAQVWVVIAFQSDFSITFPEGAYVDDIEVRKYVGDEPTLTPTATPTATSTATPTATLTPVSGDTDVYLPLVLKEHYTGPTPTPTITLTPTISPTPSKTPTPTATSEGVVPNDGNWSGTTSQARNISLLVVSNGTEVDTITISVGWGGACGVSSTTYYLYDAVINNARFYKSQGNGTEVEGTFTSATSASGDFYAVLEIPYPYCRATTSGTWTANYVP